MSNAHITPVLAAGSVASPYLFLVNLSQQLCLSTCATQPPVFVPAFTLSGFANIGTDAYVATVNVQGVISYAPCSGGRCCIVNQVVNETFTIPFTSSTAPTSVSIEAGTPVNSVSADACQTCSRSFVSSIPLTLTVG